MKNILFNNWKEKISCLLLGIAIWYLIHQNFIYHSQMEISVSKKILHE